MGREVPSGALPSAIGALVQNVATAANVAAVFETGQPLIERIITVTGRGIRKPGNWVIPFGTKLRDVIEHCGGLTDDAAEIVFGGPMMGLGQANLDVPVLKATGGILVLSKDECKRQDILPCIRCGKCLEACPVFLNPQLLGMLAKAERFEEMVSEANLNDCMLCGCCSYVCPSNIPFVPIVCCFQNPIEKTCFIMTDSIVKMTASPHVRSADSTIRIMWSVVISLVPVIAASIYFFGPSAILVLLASIAGCLITERLFGSNPGSLADGSAMITGLLLGLTLPPGFPLWMAFLGGGSAWLSARSFMVAWVRIFLTRPWSGVLFCKRLSLWRLQPGLQRRSSGGPCREIISPCPL